MRLRVWPVVIIAALLWLVRLAAPAVVSGPLQELMVRGFSSLGAALLIAIWWLFFSRAPWRERGIVAGVTVVGVAVTWLAGDESIGLFWLVMYALPIWCLTLAVSAAAGSRLADRQRLAIMTAAILVTFGSWTAIRINGIHGNGAAEFDWRWKQTAEERLLALPAEEPRRTVPPAPAPPGAATGEEPTSPAAGESAAQVAASTAVAAEPVGRALRPGETWPGFRGPQRNGIVPGLLIETNWNTAPPVALWRRPIGPGWSSFAVLGDVLFTQEQRGDDELVSAYRVDSGEPVWAHRDSVRFYETNAGAGPRATPTLSAGRVYALGATGILNALDATDGRKVWSQNAATYTGVGVPIWGFSASPIVVDDLVVVALAGTLAAFDLATGTPRWQRAGGDGYSSPHLITLGGVRQIVQMSGAGTMAVASADGMPLWTHPFPPAGSMPIVQPAITPDGDLLLSEGGVRRISVTRGSGGWSLAERWTSNRLKPYFNDYVVHKGYAYGFDGTILASLNLQDGTRAWKGGRYGQGQLVLLPDQDLLLVVSEEGEIVLVRAAPDAFSEVARFKAIEGKTWNHPVVVGDILLVRNGEEMAAFRLLRAARRPLQEPS